MVARLAQLLAKIGPVCAVKDLCEVERSLDVPFVLWSPSWVSACLSTTVGVVKTPEVRHGARMTFWHD